MGHPLVSVVIPTYNNADRVKTAIDSALNQTYREVEVIVVDDGSTDETDDIIDSITDSRLEGITLDVNKGASAARNIGIDACSGKYIAFLDSDDEWHPEKLRHQVKNIERSDNEAAINYTAWWMIFQDKTRYFPIGERPELDGKIQPRLIRGNFITTSSVLATSNCIKETSGFDESLPRLQDWDLWLRISRKFEFDFIDRPLMWQHMGGDSISGNDEMMVVALNRILQKHHNLFLQDEDPYAAHLKTLGEAYLFTGQKSKAISSLLKSWLLKPNKNTSLALFLALFGRSVYRKGIQVNWRT